MMAEELLRRTSQMMSIRWKDAAEVLGEELTTLTLEEQYVDYMLSKAYDSTLTHESAC
jgi:hypothetical protein